MSVKNDSVDPDTHSYQSHLISTSDSKISEDTESFLKHIKIKERRPSFTTKFKMNFCRMAARTINSNTFYVVNIIMPLIIGLLVFLIGKYSSYLISVSTTTNILEEAKNYDFIIPINHDYFIDENEGNLILKKLAKDFGE
ncbi:hypothetical protein RF11_13929 [Thelohanellus kitauei]|uniref:Uncharacterized protein n=1 Tax=Thelohanellus kitauei TaxID=669202 RepID=A0A0C2MH05_THEKT|nr:hypothetical protein RF11_13929 [Thelohanellus kitauei]